MNQEPGPYKACAGYCGEGQVSDDRRPGVEGVIADATAVGVKDGTGQEMVEIDEKPREHDSPGKPPPGAPAQSGDGGGDQEMKH